MAGQSKPIYMAWNFRWKDIKIRANYSKDWKLQRKYTKEETLLKLHRGQTPTVPVMSGNKMEENPPRLPTLGRAALASVRKQIQSIRAIVWPEGKHAYCMSPGTLRKSVKYSSIIRPSTPQTGQMKKKPAPEATKKTVRPYNLTEQHKRLTAWLLVMHLYQERKN